MPLRSGDRRDHALTEKNGVVALMVNPILTLMIKNSQGRIDFGGQSLTINGNNGPFGASTIHLAHPDASAELPLADALIKVAECLSC